MNNLPFKVTKKIKRHFKATLDFWDDARKSENKINEKREWKHYRKIDLLCWACAFCEYYLINREDKTLPYCTDCPLYKNKICANGHYVDSGRVDRLKLYFWIWNDCEDNHKNKYESANKIYQFIKKWYDENIEGAKC